MGWKIYFWLLSLLLFAAYVIIAIDGLTVFDVMDIPISIIALIGLYGFAFKKKIFVKEFWKLWAFVIVLWDISYNFFLATYPDVSKFETAMVLLILLPEYVALSLYAYFPTTLWKESTV